MNKRRSFVDRPELDTLIAYLFVGGAMCPKCGYGTRKTSKNWRRCKRTECDERIHMVIATSAEIDKAVRDAVTNSTEPEGVK